jgi:hypothetical protein
MAREIETQALTQVRFTPEDFEPAEQLARALGYRQYAYTDTSDLWGLFCMAENPEHAYGPRCGGCVIKTRELGLLFVQDASDLRVLVEREERRLRHG